MSRPPDPELRRPADPFLGFTVPGIRIHNIYLWIWNTAFITVFLLKGNIIFVPFSLLTAVDKYL
jgi:hypothetical protein